MMCCHCRFTLPYFRTGLTKPRHLLFWIVKQYKNLLLLSILFYYQGSISSTCSRAAFRCADTKSAKKLLDLNDFFALLGSAHVKADHKMLEKLTPARTFKTLTEAKFLLINFTSSNRN